MKVLRLSPMDGRDDQKSHEIDGVVQAHFAFSLQPQSLSVAKEAWHALNVVKRRGQRIFGNRRGRPRGRPASMRSEIGGGHIPVRNRKLRNVPLDALSYASIFHSPDR
jgi:hypothetical protein